MMTSVFIVCVFGSQVKLEPEEVRHLQSEAVIGVVPLCLVPITFDGLLVDAVFRGFGSDCLYVAFRVVVDNRWYLRRACNYFLRREPNVGRNMVIPCICRADRDTCLVTE
jgi:hypothetical protein